MFRDRVWGTSLIVILLLQVTILMIQPSNVVGVERNPYRDVPMAPHDWNETLTEDLLYLLEMLEDLREIISKYNETLANKLGEIELDIAEGDIYGSDGALAKIKDLEDELKSLLDYLKTVNVEDYNRVMDILSEDLVGYLTGRAEIYDLIDPSKISAEDIYIPEATPGLIDEGGLQIPRLPGIEAPRPSLPEIPAEFMFLVIATLGVFTGLYFAYRYNLWARFGGAISDIFRRAGIIKHRDLDMYENEVYEAYHRFLHVSSIYGYPRYLYEGPIEHVDRIGDNDLRSVGLSIGELFERIRYGLKPITVRDREAIKRIIDDINRLEKMME